MNFGFVLFNMMALAVLVTAQETASSTAASTAAISCYVCNELENSDCGQGTPEALSKYKQTCSNGEQWCRKTTQNGTMIRIIILLHEI